MSRYKQNINWCKYLLFKQCNTQVQVTCRYLHFSQMFDLNLSLNRGKQVQVNLYLYLQIISQIPVTNLHLLWALSSSSISCLLRWFELQTFEESLASTSHNLFLYFSMFRVIYTHFSPLLDHFLFLFHIYFCHSI